jgi:hypothetical protein
MSTYIRTTYNYLRRDYRLSLKAGLSSHTRVAMADRLATLTGDRWIKAMVALSSHRAYDHLGDAAGKELAHLMGQPIEIAGPLEVLP